MVRIRRNPAPLPDLHRRMERVMERFLHDLPVATLPRGWAPRADLYETGDGFVATLELPGIDREQIDIVVEGPYLSVTGYRPEPETGACLRWHQMEIAHGPFERVIALPEEADLERISATYRDGFLEIVIPRARGTSRTVPVEEG